MRGVRTWQFTMTCFISPLAGEHLHPCLPDVAFHQCQYNLEKPNQIENGECNRLYPVMEEERHDDCDGSYIYDSKIELKTYYVSSVALLQRP